MRHLRVDKARLEKTLEAFRDRAADYEEYCSEMEDEYRYSVADLENGIKILSELLLAGSDGVQVEVQ